MCGCCYAALSMPSSKEVTQLPRGAKTPTGKEPLTEDYPGLEPASLPAPVEEALFKFKGQDPLLRGDSSTGNIRAVPGAAAAMGEVGVYHMAQEEMTLRERPLNAAVSIAPRHRLSRTASSLGPDTEEADGPVRTWSSLVRTRSSLADPATRSLMQRTGSSVGQYDAEVGTLPMIAQFPNTYLCTPRCICLRVYSKCLPIARTTVTFVCGALLDCISCVQTWPLWTRIFC